MPNTSKSDLDTTANELIGDSAVLKFFKEALKFERANPNHAVYYTPQGTLGGDEGIAPASRMLDQYIAIETTRVRDLGALLADRIDQGATSVSVDLATGEVLGALSDAARAARYAMQQRLIAKGLEDPGWGR
jgi:hypothetical protein